jgi:hypothetical protein
MRRQSAKEPRLGRWKPFKYWLKTKYSSRAGSGEKRVLLLFDPYTLYVIDHLPYSTYIMSYTQLLTSSPLVDSVWWCWKMQHLTFRLFLSPLYYTSGTHTGRPPLPLLRLAFLLCSKETRRVGTRGAAFFLQSLTELDIYAARSCNRPLIFFSLLYLPTSTA